MNKRLTADRRRIDGEARECEGGIVEGEETKNKLDRQTERSGVCI